MDDKQHTSLSFPLLSSSSLPPFPMDTSHGAQPTGGFSFEFAERNALLETRGIKAPTSLKTGTTIAGIKFKDGIVLGADTRATDGDTVADKNCEKIHYIAPNIYCCGAGVSADTEQVTAMVSSSLVLHRLATRRASRVVTAVTLLKQHLFRYRGYVQAALVLGGVDVTGPHLYTVWPHGSVDKLPFVSMGSGSLAAMAVFESGYRDGMEQEDAVRLVQAAVRGGIFNDLGSGSNVDITIIRKDDVDRIRGFDTPNERKFRNPRGYMFPPGTTAVLDTKVEKFASIASRVEVLEGDHSQSMDMGEA